MKGKPPTAELDATRADVLIVDDDASLRETLLESLQQLGFVTLAAASGAGALRLARERSPRLIVLDLTVPGRSGWPFLEHRRRDPRLRDIPVIAISASPQDVSTRDVQAVLPKPLDERRLVAALRQSLLAAAGSEGPKSILVVEDDEDTRAEVSELLEEQGYRVARAGNGAEAEALLRASPRPDCIILDLWMPVMDGWRFATRLQQFGTPPIPVVVVTAAEPYWGYPVSLSQVIRKPIHAESLLAMVNEVLPAPAESPQAGGRSLPRRRR
jgi:CheY-like chemotaxis protein